MDALDRTDHLLQHLADVLGADVDRGRVAQRLARPRRQLGVPADRVLELRPVCVDRMPPPGGRRDRASHQEMVGEDEIGREQVA